MSASVTWGEMMVALSEAKSSIFSAAEYALKLPEEADQLIAGVIARLEDPAPNRRAALFLVDCICQRSHKAGENRFVRATATFMTRLLRLVLPESWEGTANKQTNDLLESARKTRHGLNRLKGKVVSHKATAAAGGGAR